MGFNRTTANIHYVSIYTNVTQIIICHFMALTVAMVPNEYSTNLVHYKQFVPPFQGGIDVLKVFLYLAGKKESGALIAFSSGRLGIALFSVKRGLMK